MDVESGTGPSSLLSEDLTAKLAALGPLIDVIADGVVIYDTTGIKLRENAAARILFGLDVQPDYNAQPIAERSRRLDIRDAEGRLLPVAALPMLRVGHGEVLTGETAMDMHLTSLDGRGLVVNATGMPLRNATGAIIGGVVVYRDVTERRRQEAVLAAERGGFYTTLQHAPAMITVFAGPEHRFEFVNAASIALLGERGFLGKTVREVQPELPGPGMYELLDRVYQTGEPIVGRTEPVTVDTSQGPQERHYTFALQARRTATGVIDGVVSFAFDVTEQVEAIRRVEALVGQLAAERDWLRQVVDALPEAVQIVNAEGRYVLANRASAVLAGFDVTGTALPAGERDSFAVYGTRRGDGTLAQPDDLPLRRALGGEGLHGIQLLLRQRGSGRDFPVLTNSAPLRDSTGRVTGAVAVFQDITALKELEQLRDEFLAIASHDLNNALTTIRGTSQLLRRRAGKLPSAEGDQLTAGLDLIIQTAARMADHINELLDSTRLEMGQPLDLNLQPTDLPVLLARLVAEHDQASERHMVRLVAPEEALVGLYDATRLEWLMRNLLNNAIKYSPDGGLVEVVLSYEDGPEGAVVSIQVRDQGIGIPANELELVFGRFVRGSNVVGRIKGTGIGLAGVRQIVEQHGGTVALASEEGVGTTATIRLKHRPATGK